MRAVQRPAALRFHLLGHIRAFVHGDTFALATPRKTPQLLAYLLLHRGATVLRDYLAFLFWPDDPEDAARSKLRSNLFDLSRLLPPAPEGRPWFSADGTGVRWNGDAETTVDVEDFDAAIGARELEEAVALYDGDLLEGCYDEWLLAPRERLRGAYLGALSELISDARRAMDYPKAIAFAKRLLQADPLREDVARRLIALRYEAGDRAGALDEYARFVERLQQELAIGPMPETVVLHGAIVRNEPLPASDRRDAEDVPIAGATRTRRLLPFVGREHELNRLLDGWNRAARGRGGVALVDGAPGIGKSRLVAELARAVEERGGRVLAGATGFPEAMPYQALLEALRGALPLLASTRPDVAWLPVLATLLPELSHLVDGVPALRPVAPESERTRTLAALVGAFVAIAQARPLLVVLEDLHWAQDATMAALALLARRTALSPVFVVATYRDGDVSRGHALRGVRDEVLRAGWGSGITLRPLSVEEVAEIGRGVGSPVLASPQELRAACAGNPLLLEQLLAEPAPDTAQGVELRIETIVDAQLERLSAPARTFAEVAALVGARFSYEVIREVGGWDAASATEALDELLDCKIVREAGGYGDFDYAFAHQLICNAVAERAPERRAADRHRRIARAIGHLFPERTVEFAGELARHYERAGDSERAAAHYLLAGRRALQMSALHEAAVHLRRGVALSGAATVRADGLVTLAEVSRRTGDRAGRAAALSALEEAVESLDDEHRRTAALLRVQFSATESDADEAAKARAQLRSLVECGGAHWRAASLIEDARAAFLAEDLETAMTLAQSALDAARESDDLDLTAQALVAVARVRGEFLEVDDALDLFEEAQNAAFRAGNGIVELEALLGAHKVACELERAESALTFIERALERATMLGDRNAEAQARIRVAINRLALRRDLDRVLAALAEPAPTYEELGSRRGVARVLANRAAALHELGDFDGEIALLERAYADFAGLGERTTATSVLSSLAVARSYSGDRERGAREALAALERVPAEGIEWLRASVLEDVAITDARRGDLAAAREHAEEALALQKRIPSIETNRRLLGDLAVWAARCGDLQAARRHVDEMLAGPLPVMTVFPQTCPWAAAQVFHACGEEVRARQYLEKAYSLVAPLAAELNGEARRRFESIPCNAEILAAHANDEWPEFPSS